VYVYIIIIIIIIIVIYTKAEVSRLVGAGASPLQILAIWRRGLGILRVPVGGISTPRVLNLALRVLNLVTRVLNLVPGTQYPVLYRKNRIENFPRRKSHPQQKPPPLARFWDSGLLITSA
jgi:hypothetical protein